MAPSRLPPHDAILAALARRTFGDWTRYHFPILDKNGLHSYLVLNQVQRAIDAHEDEMLATKGEAKLYVLKARQGGVTTHQQAKSLHTVTEIRGSRALTLAHDRDATDKIFGITQYAVDNFRGHLPELGRKQTKEYSFPSLNTRFYTGTAGARRTGRGLTLRRLHGSEFAFWDDPKGTLNSVTPALIPNGSVAVLETTASGFDTDAHRYWRDAKAGANSFRTLFFAWWECDLVNYQIPLLDRDELGTLDDEETLLVRERKLTLEQIKWRRKKILDMGGKDDFLQEYPEDDESCWLAVGGMYYAAKDLRALQLKAPVPIRKEMADELDVYSELQEGERAIIGADTAEGVNQDRSTFVARAFPSWRLLRTYGSPRVQPKEFAGILNEQGRLLDGAFLVIEKNMHGITVLRHLRDDHMYPITQIYHRAPLDQSAPEASTRIGWATTEESKAIMLAAGRELLTAALQGLAGVPCAAVITDAFGVRRGDNGKFNLNGRDMLVAEMLSWIGRNAPTGLGMLDFMKEMAAAAQPPVSNAPMP